MPELPEVETIVRDLKKFLPGLKITDVWTDVKKFKGLKRQIVGEKILNIERRAKNILIRLSDSRVILVHQKMTGHLLYGKYQKSNLKSQKWVAVGAGPLRDDPENRFIHLLFFLSNGYQLVLCDMRKFAKVIVLSEKEIQEELEKIGIDPFDKKLTFEKFKEFIKYKKAAKGEPRLRRGAIKKVLMDQSAVSGIGNIYSDEILWLAGIHPLRDTQKLSNPEIKKIYQSIRPILTKAIKARGSSYIDYRDALGKKGKYQTMHLAYQMTGIKCKKNDGGIIKKIKINGRSAHFCPVHQML